VTFRLYLTAFVGGVVSLALELSASRLLEPFFGTSNLVWAAVIGLILLYLAVGYAIGGRWADRSPRPATLYLIMVAAGVAIAVVPFAARPVLDLASRGMGSWNAGMVGGAFIGVLILFSIPVTLLACISPFVIRLGITDLALSGVTSGQVYAVSTGGSFVGTYLPVLVLIPAFGTRRTFLILALLTVATGLLGLWSVDRKRFWQLCWIAPVILGLVILGGGLIKPRAGLIYEKESSYNFIQVVEDESHNRYLFLNEGQ
jgi:MFS family permease